MLRRALDDHGVTFFDAADAYGNGRAERQIAEAFRGRRERGRDRDEGRLRHLRRSRARCAARAAASCRCAPIPPFIRFAVDRCLERLETDYIDVLQIHNAKMEHVRDAGAVGYAARPAAKEGKIRAWGAAFGPAIGWLYESVELVEREPDINTIQMIWNVLEQHPGSAMIEAARRHAPNCCFNVRVTHAQRHARGEVHRGHGVPRERSPSSSSAHRGS